MIGDQTQRAMEVTPEKQPPQTTPPVPSSDDSVDQDVSNYFHLLHLKTKK